MDSLFQLLLASRPDPLAVLETTAYVVQDARFVKIQMDEIKRAADILVKEQLDAPAWNDAYHFSDGTERTVNYLFWLDALNFCFWGQPRWSVEYHGIWLDGYWALAAALKRAAEEKPNTLEADFWARISPQELQHILRGRSQIPMFADRWKNTRELGAVLCEHWSAKATNLVAAAQADAPRLARLIADNLSSFRDIAIYQGREVRLFKRAQILVGDLWGAFRGKDWGKLDKVDQLTAFADYKLPQILRAWQVLRYAPDLARRIDGKVQLAAGSPEEVEIRAATLWAVEFLRQELAVRGRALWSIQVDWILWHASQERSPALLPYHRVRTVYY
jgi:hypothetical protein